jgi:dephospho-CoA kinase
MVSVALTGNVASGKSHIAEIFRGLGAHVIDADKIAHAALEQETLHEITKHFPSAIEDGRINRKELGRIVFADGAKLKMLEEILHPLVRRKYLEFLKQHKDRLTVVEIPLLFETGADVFFDFVIYVDVHPETQKERALKRHNMTQEKLNQMLARQHKISPAEKKLRADFVIDNNPHADTMGQIKNIMAKIS